MSEAGRCECGAAAAASCAFLAERVGERPPSCLLAADAPLPLVAPDAELPPFPTDVLPDWLAAWVAGIAAEKGSRDDLPGCLVLGIAAAAIQRGVFVSPRPGYVEPCSLYAIAALPPGARKTPVFLAAMRPVRAIEAALADGWRKDQAAWAELERLKAETDRDSKRIAALERQRKQLSDDQAAELAGLREAVESGERADRIVELSAQFPDGELGPSPRLRTADATPEAVARLLAGGGQGRILIASDEGAAFFANLAGRYSGSADWDAFNAGHSGGPVMVDRATSEPLSVDHAAISLVLATQPAVVVGLCRESTAAGRGVLARPLYAIPGPYWPDLPTREADQTAVNRYLVKMKALWERVPKPTRNEHGELTGVPLKLTPQAVEAFQAWETECQARCRAMLEGGQASPEAVAWQAKLAGQTARLAAVLHVLDAWTGETLPRIDGEHGRIPRPTVDRAIVLARYFQAHAAAVFGLASEGSDLAPARRVLAAIARRAVDGTLGRDLTFSTRDVRRWVGNKEETAYFAGALRVLADHGWLESVPTERANASPRWKASPAVAQLEPRDATPTDSTDIPTDGEIVT